MKILWLVAVLGLASPALAAEPPQPSSLGFAHMDFHRESKDGQAVLVVSGDIVNKANRELPVPQTLRVTLSDAANHALYHWDYTPTVQTLKPGQSAPFVTRFPSPPAAALHLDVRFAKNGS